MDIPVRMKTAILWSSAAAGGVGIPGAFGAHLDIAAIAGIWITLLVRLGNLADAQMERAKAAKIVAAVLAGISFFKLGFKIANTYFAYTGIGTLPAIVANAGANAGVTYLFGRASARVFLSEQVADSAETIAGTILALMGGSNSDYDSSV